MTVLYKYSQFLGTSTSEAFDTICEVSTTCKWSGIYRCEGCGKSETSVKGTTLPPQNHHQHTPSQGKIRWRLSASHS
jgi:hypothetical protein